MLTDQQPFSGEGEQILKKVRQGRFARPRAVKAIGASGARSDLPAVDGARAVQALPVGLSAGSWISSDGWPTQAVVAWKDPWFDRVRRWVRRHQPLVAGAAAALLVALVALGVAVPLLSVAWGNESGARRNERSLRMLAMEKAEEAQELQQVAMRHSEIARRERASALASEAKANEERDARGENAQVPGGGVSQTGSRPSTVARSKSSTCSIELSKKSTSHSAINL